MAERLQPDQTKYSPRPPDAAPALTVHSGAFHPTLENCLLDNIRSIKTRDPLEPVVIAAGSSLLVEYLTWRCAEVIPPAVNLHILTLRALVDRLAGALNPAASESVPPRGADLAAAALALEQSRSGAIPAFAAVSSRPGFLPALLETLRDLVEGVHDPANIERWLKGGTNPNLKALAGMWSSWAQAMSGWRSTPFSLPEGDVGAAFGRLFGTDRLHLYGIYDLNAVQCGFVRRLTGGIGVEFYLPYRQAQGDYGSAFSFVKGMFDRLKGWTSDQHLIPTEHVSTRALSGRLFNFNPGADAATTSGSVSVDTTPQIELFRSGDGLAELDSIAGRIGELIIHQGVSPADVGVLLWNPQRLLPPLRLALERAGIPFHDAIGRSLMEAAQARAFADLLNLAGQPLQRRALCDLLARSDFDLPSDPVTWESISLEAGLVEGDRAAWLAALDKLRYLWENPPLHESSPPPNKFEQLALFRAFLDRLFAGLDAFIAADSWGGVAAAASDILAGILNDGELREALEGVISDLTVLDKIGGKPTPAIFTAALNRLTASVSLPVAGAKQTRYREGGVTLCDRYAARGMSFRVLFIPGMTSDAVPVKSGEDPILSDRERRAFNERHTASGDFLPLKSERIMEERLLFALAADSARERLYLSWHRLSGSGKECLPSRYIAELCRVVTGASVASEQIERLPFFTDDETLRDRDTLLRRSSDRDAALLRLLRSINPEGNLSAAVERVFAGSTGFFDRHIEAFRARSHGGDFSPWDGMLSASGSVVDNTGEGLKFRVTELENYAKCPHQYYFARRLGLEPWDEPEKALSLTPLQVGILVHSALEAFHSKPEVQDKLQPGASGEGLRDELEASLLSSLQEQVVKAKQRWSLPDAIWRVEHQRLSLRLRGYLRWLLQNPPDFTTLKTEYGIEYKPVSTAFPGMRLTGRADRIDSDDAASRVVITDYKTGNIPKIAGMDAGHSLQLYVYLNALLDETSADPERSSARYLGIGADGSVNDKQSLSGMDARESRARLDDIIGALVGAMQAGVFAPLPEEKVCRYCDYASICDLRGRKSAERRIETDPRMRELLGRLNPDA